MTNEMDAIHDALAQHTSDYRVGDRLHAVPPHLVYEVWVDGRRAVCKVATQPTGDPVVEGLVTEYVDRHTSVPVPPILGVGRDPDHFLAGWVDDAPRETGGDLEADRARAMGRGLATLHADTAFDAPGVPADRDGFAVDQRPTWNATAVDYLREVRAYLAPRGFGAVATRAIEFLRACEPLADAPDPVLCHGNYLPDHAAVREGRVVRVIDFEHALVGPGEYDYWRTGMPCFEGPFGPDDSPAPGDDPVHRAFRDGYESVRQLPGGFERRAPVYWLVNGVSYLRALFVQNEFDQSVARRARWLEDHLGHALETLADRYG